MEGHNYMHNGFCAKRLEDGSVQLRHYRDATMTTVIWERILPEGVWASLVSSVSNRGEDGTTYNEALEFHNK